MSLEVEFPLTKNGNWITRRIVRHKHEFWRISRAGQVEDGSWKVAEFVAARARITVASYDGEVR